MVRRQTCQTHIELLVFERTLKWWYRILVMTEFSYPKICYNQLQEKSKTNQTKSKYNWVLQLQNVVTKINYGWLWERQSCVMLKEN